jgi:acetyltransferase-like isoleucine patch superfamily enzyme
MKQKLKLFLKGLAFYLANHYIARLPSFRFRHWYYRKILRYHLGHSSSIHMDVFVTGTHIVIGNHTVINRRTHLDGRIGIRIGNNVNISPEVYIVSMEHDPQDPQFSTRGGEVVIDNHAWIGVRALILPGVRIGTGAVVGAGAVVTKDVEPYHIVAGVPARKIGERNHQINYQNRYFPWFDTDVQRD